MMFHPKVQRPYPPSPHRPLPGLKGWLRRAWRGCLLGGLLLLGGCSAAPHRAGSSAVSCPQAPRPPAVLMAAEPIPSLQGETWGDVALLAAEAVHGLAQCNADKAALRGWAEGLK